MWRVAIGGFGAESNAFSVEKPGDESASVTSGEKLLSAHRGRKTVLGGFLEVLDEAGVETVPTIRVFWGATGVIRRVSYERFKAELVESLRSAGRLDGVLLDLHGAMLAEGYPDAEGVLLKEVREVAGVGAPILCVLDIHGNVTDLKVQEANVLFGYRTNPHVDLYERGVKAARTLLAMLRREVKPVMRVKRLPMLGPNLGMSTWAFTAEAQERLPFNRIMRTVASLEKEPGMVDISVFIGFAHADMPQCVTTAVAVSDDDPALAQSMADRVAQMVWEAREEFVKLRPLIPVDEAVDRALKASRWPVILVDVADNSGGGAPCDNTVILEALLRKGVEDAVVPLRDPEAVAEAFAAGPGAILDLDVGGKVDGRFYKPVRIRATVKTLTDGRYVIRGPHHGGYPVREGLLPKEAWSLADVGRTALLKTDGVEVIVSEGRVGMERDYYKAAGVDPAERRIVVVKSAQAHRASFEGIAAEIIEVDTPGSCSSSYRGLAFKNVPRPIWPLDPL
ncbi:MAG: M81 family metallopeptidase [Candidatus Bathyarchaeia archaeon]